MYNFWIALRLSVARLGWDAQNMIALSLVRFSAGHVGPTEAGLMITEKIAAATEVHAVRGAGLIKTEIVDRWSLEESGKRIGYKKPR